MHVPSHWSRETKSLCGMRDVLVGSRTRLVNSVRGYLRQMLKRFQGGTAATLLVRVAQALCGDRTTGPTASGAAAPRDRAPARGGEGGDAGGKRVGGAEPGVRPPHDGTGVGAITAVRFVAAVDQVERFSNAHQLESYLGLTPGEDSSSDRRRITSITKAGPSAVRWVLVQAAWAAMRTRPEDPMCRWALQIASRRGGLIATIALARKLAGILFAMWRDGTSYQWRRGAAPVETSAPA